MAGSAFNFPTPLSVSQQGYPDIHSTAEYDTKPFGPFMPYYAWRVSLLEKNGAWELEHVHHRLFLTNPPPEIQDFAIHFGYNFFLLGYAWNLGDFVLHLDAGPIFTSPFSTIRGQIYSSAGVGFLHGGYTFSGLGAQAALSRNLYITNNFYFILEAALIPGWAWAVPVANGNADVPNIGLHGHLGTGVRF